MRVKCPGRSLGRDAGDGGAPGEGKGKSSPGTPGAEMGGPRGAYGAPWGAGPPWGQGPQRSAGRHRDLSVAIRDAQEHQRGV